MFNVLLKTFLVLLSIMSGWVIYVSQDQSKLLNQFSDGYVWQLKTGIKDATRNYLLPAKNIAKLGSDMFRNGLVSLDNPQTLSTFVFPFVDSYPQLNSYFVGTEENEFWFWRNDYAADYTYLIDRIEKDPQGVLIAQEQFLDAEQRVLRKSKPAIAEYTPMTRSWYRGAKALGAGFWSDVYAFTSFKDPNIPGITASYPIYDHTGRLLGVWGVDIELRELSMFLSDIGSSRGADLVIFNERKNVIAYSGLGRVPITNKLLSLSDLDNAIVQKALASYQRHGFSEFFFTEDGNRYLASYSPFLLGEEKDWNLLLVLPESQLIEHIGLNLVLISIFAIIVFMTSMVCLVLLFRLPVLAIVKQIVRK